MTSPPPIGRKQMDSRTPSSGWIGVLAWGATAFGATVILLLCGVIWLRPSAADAPHLLPLLVFATLMLALGAVRLMLGHIRRELVLRDHLLMRISRRLRSVLPANDSMRLSSPAGGQSIEDELERVLAGYRSAVGLEARVAELERELEMERQGQIARASRPAADGRAGGEGAPREPTPAEGAGAERPPVETIPAEGEKDAGGGQREVIERTLRLTETSFVAGSDALVRVRTAVRAIRDWRQRVAGRSPRVMPEGQTLTPGHLIPRDSRHDEAQAEVFECLATEVRRLVECANRLWSLADAAESIAGFPTSSLPPATLSQPPRGSARDADRATPLSGPEGRHASVSGPARGPGSELVITALRLRGLAAELESGLAGLGTEVRVLGRAWRARAEDGGRSGQRNGPDPALARALDRLETQLTEVADDIAAFTRDAEQLSRELDRLRASGQRRSAD